MMTNETTWAKRIHQIMQEKYLYDPARMSDLRICAQMHIEQARTNRTVVTRLHTIEQASSQTLADALKSDFNQKMYALDEPYQSIIEWAAYMINWDALADELIANTLQSNL